MNTIWHKILMLKILTNLTKICPFVDVFCHFLKNPTEHGAAILLLTLHIKGKWRLETTFVNIFLSNIKLDNLSIFYLVNILCYMVCD